jgi:hypothetical protein
MFDLVSVMQQLELLDPRIDTIEIRPGSEITLLTIYRRKMEKLQFLLSILSKESDNPLRYRALCVYDALESVIKKEQKADDREQES